MSRNENPTCSDDDNDPNKKLESTKEEMTTEIEISTVDEELPTDKDVKTTEIDEPSVVDELPLEKDESCEPTRSSPELRDSFLKCEPPPKHYTSSVFSRKASRATSKASTKDDSGVDDEYFRDSFSKSHSFLNTTRKSLRNLMGRFSRAKPLGEKGSTRSMRNRESKASRSSKSTVNSEKSTNYSEKSTPIHQFRMVGTADGSDREASVRTIEKEMTEEDKHSITKGEDVQEELELVRGQFLLPDPVHYKNIPHVLEIMNSVPFGFVRDVESDSFFYGFVVTRQVGTKIIEKFTRHPQLNYIAYDCSGRIYRCTYHAEECFCFLISNQDRDLSSLLLAIKDFAGGHLVFADIFARSTGSYFEDHPKVSLLNREVYDLCANNCHLMRVPNKYIMRQYLKR